MKNKSITIDTKKLFIFNLHHFIRYVFGGQVLPMITILSLVFVFDSKTLFIFDLFLIVVTMMAYKLAFDVLADTAQGNMSPMVSENYLVSNMIAVKVFIITFIIGVIFALLIFMNYNSYIQYGFVVVSGCLIPAMYMSLALTNSLMSSFNPFMLFKLIKTMHISYLLFVLFSLLISVSYERVINPFILDYFHVFISGIISGFIKFVFLILGFHIMGYMLFQNREALELKGIVSNLIDEDKVTIQKNELNPAHENIKRLLDDDQIEQAMSIILGLKNNGDNSNELHELSKQAMEMKLFKPSNINVAEKIHFRLRDGFDSKALNLVIEHLYAGKEYVETTPEDVKSLIKYAVVANKPKYIPILIKGFHKKYPYHADIVPNYFLLAKVLYDNESTRDKSKEVLQFLIEKYPNDVYISEVKAWLKGVEMIGNR